MYRHMTVALSLSCVWRQWLIEFVLCTFIVWADVTLLGRAKCPHDPVWLCIERNSCFWSLGCVSFGCGVQESSWVAGY